MIRCDVVLGPIPLQHLFPAMIRCYIILRPIPFKHPFPAMIRCYIILGPIPFKHPFPAMIRCNVVLGPVFLKHLFPAMIRCNVVLGPVFLKHLFPAMIRCYIILGPIFFQHTLSKSIRATKPFMTIFFLHSGQKLWGQEWTWCTQLIQEDHTDLVLNMFGLEWKLDPVFFEMRPAYLFKYFWEHECSQNAVFFKTCLCGLFTYFRVLLSIRDTMIRHCGFHNFLLNLITLGGVVHTIFFDGRFLGPIEFAAPTQSTTNKIVIHNSRFGSTNTPERQWLLIVPILVPGRQQDTSTSLEGIPDRVIIRPVVIVLTLGTRTRPCRLLQVPEICRRLIPA